MTESRQPQAEPGSLRVEGVHKRFGPVEVLRGVGLEAGRGEFITLLGPSGCGKTTLLRIIAGFEHADSGTVTLGGRDLAPLPPRLRPVNMVFQHYALFPHLTVRDNVGFGLESRRIPAIESGPRVDVALEMLRIGPLAGRMPHELSGGQRQRVALARALVNQPELLLLDEPMSALDAKLRSEVQLELRRLQRGTGRTFILVTHDQDEAMTVSDRILVMREGLIEQAGSPAEVYERPRTRFVASFLGAANLIEAVREGGAYSTPLGPLIVSAPAAQWDRGTLAIRPERITLTANPPPVNAVRIVISEVVYRGDHLDAFAAEADLRIRVPANGIRPAGGDLLWACLPPEALHPLDP